MNVAGSRVSVMVVMTKMIDPDFQYMNKKDVWKFKKSIL